jgi:hypothetical protein
MENSISTYKDYSPSRTGAHASEDIPVIKVIAAYLSDSSHSVEQLLMCVSSGAIEAQRVTESHDRGCALGWLSWKASETAAGEVEDFHVTRVSERGVYGHSADCCDEGGCAAGSEVYFAEVKADGVREGGVYSIAQNGEIVSEVE